MKNSFFYNAAEIKKLNALLNTGEHTRTIAENHHKEFNVSANALYSKLCKLSRAKKENIYDAAFYNEAETLRIEKLIDTGEGIRNIGRKYYKEFNTTKDAFIQKLYRVKRKRKNVNKPTNTIPVKTTIEKRKPQGLAVPNGTRFEGVAKKVELFQDHFCVYF
jgi:hypothetical protein